MTLPSWNADTINISKVLRMKKIGQSAIGLRMRTNQPKLLHRIRLKTNRYQLLLNNEGAAKCLTA